MCVNGSIRKVATAEQGWSLPSGDGMRGNGVGYLDFMERELFAPVPFRENVQMLKLGLW